MTQYIVTRRVIARRGPGRGLPLGFVKIGKIFDDVKSVPNFIAYQHSRNGIGWIPAYACLAVTGTIPPITPPPVTGIGIYRTLHPLPSKVPYVEHDGLQWPDRGDDYPVYPNYGSFDVYSRLFTLPNKSSDGGAIKLTGQQWEAVQRKNGYRKEYTNWAVRTTSQIMMWGEGYPYPVFHYPISFGGNFVKVLGTYGKFARIATWPAGKDVPDDLPYTYWMRCWSLYSGLNPIRDAPSGPGHVAYPSYMLLLAHSDSAWVHSGGLIPA